MTVRELPAIDPQLSLIIREDDRCWTSRPIDRLRDDGVPTVSDEEFADALDELDGRRRRLLALVEADAWYWPPVERE